MMQKYEPLSINYNCTGNDMCHYAEIECLLYGDRLAKNKKHKKKHPEIKKKPREFIQEQKHKV